VERKQFFTKNKKTKHMGKFGWACVSIGAYLFMSWIVETLAEDVHDEFVLNVAFVMRWIALGMFLFAAYVKYKEMNAEMVKSSRKILFDRVSREKILNSNFKILVIGQGGAGKTTLAKEIAAQFQLQYVGFDRLAVKPNTNWEKRNLQEFQAAFQETMRKLPTGQGVVFEGILIDAHDSNHCRQLIIEQMLQRGEFSDVVWIDVPFEVRIYRIVKRSIRRWLGLEAQGANVEKFSNVKALLSKQWKTSETTLSRMNSIWRHWHSLYATKGLNYSSISCGFEKLKTFETKRVTTKKSEDVCDENILSS
jgi:adenylate kinase family enzyme